MLNVLRQELRRTGSAALCFAFEPPRRAALIPLSLPPPVVIVTALEAAPVSVVQEGELYGQVDAEKTRHLEGAEQAEVATQCAQGNDGEIMVCAAVSSDYYRIGPLPPHRPSAMEELDRALTIKVGPAEIKPSGLGIGLRIRF